MKEKEVKKQLKVIDKGVKKATISKSSAIKILQRAGIISNSGKLTKNYSTNNV